MYIFHFIFAWGGGKILWKLLHRPFRHHPDVVYVAVFVISVCASYALSVVSGRYIEIVGIDRGKRIIRSIEERDKSLALSA